MPLTSAQRTALVTDIAADSTLSQLQHNSDGASAVAAAYNLTASPDFWVWRMIPVSEYKGAGGIVWTEVDTLTVAKARIFEWLTGNLTLPIDAADTNVQAGIGNAFAVGTTTRANLTTLGRERATRAEKLFANTSQGAGTTAAPATRTHQRPFTAWEVEQAWAV
jgi:hypothetical protein